MHLLSELLGVESGLEEISAALRRQTQREHPPVVGAVQVNCSDESERECLEAFQKTFVECLLPELKFWSKSPFRCCNLGGRYEWGAVRIAEQHFALPESGESFMAMVVKINSHVSVRQTPEGFVFGPMDRYRTESAACGALHALLEGTTQPFTHELSEAFTSEGHDLTDMLRRRCQTVA